MVAALLAETTNKKKGSHLIQNVSIREWITKPSTGIQLHKKFTSCAECIF